MLSSPPIYFHYLVPLFHFPNRNRLKKFLHSIILNEGHTLDSINFIFCTDEHLLDINQRFLKHNTYTDIITFQHSNKLEPILSDIYISVETVRDNSKQFSKSFLNELHRVIFHGVLHLCGYKDKTVGNKNQMTNKEDYYLDKYFVSREI